MKTLILIFTLISIISCSNEKPYGKSSSDHPKYLFENILYHNNKDTIFIKSQFADCGEWGGHKELIKIYQSKKRIKLSYIKFGVDCGIRDSLGSIIQVKKLERNILLSNSQQIALMKYMNKLMQLQFIDIEFGNSGNSFSVEDSKGKLKVSQYGNSIHLLNNYNYLMTNLNLSKVAIEYE